MSQDGVRIKPSSQAFPASSEFLSACSIRTKTGGGQGFWNEANEPKSHDYIMVVSHIRDGPEINGPEINGPEINGPEINGGHLLFSG